MTQPSNLQVLMMMMKKVMLATLSGVSNVGQLTTRQRTKGREGKVSERLPACHADKNTNTKTIAKIQTNTNLDIYTFTTERDDLGTVGFAWRIQNESSRASKNSEVFTKFYFPQKRKCKQVSDVRFVQHMSQQLCLPVQKEWQKCTGLVCHSFLGEVKWRQFLRC